MSKTQNSAYSTSSVSGSACFNQGLSTAKNDLIPENDNLYPSKPIQAEIGKYSVFAVANWFLMKNSMTQKKLQKLCYYAQAWNYALNDFRLIDSDFQAWVHGPVSPALYERFKNFGYSAIIIDKEYKSRIASEDLELLESVWKTYGEHTGNALEALSHNELPWIEARRGYRQDENCQVVITPESMKEYYLSIYEGGEA